MPLDALLPACLASAPIIRAGHGGRLMRLNGSNCKVSGVRFALTADTRIGFHWLPAHAVTSGKTIGTKQGVMAKPISNPLVTLKPS
ncbi:MAG: hypothetical protein PVJ66_10510 [Gammaproteobacteria bacterium]|jgi:hypothetical protein